MKISQLFAKAMIILLLSILTWVPAAVGNSVIRVPLASNDWVVGMRDGTADPLGYYTGGTRANKIGSRGGSGNRQHSNPVLKFALPELSGTDLLHAQLKVTRFENDTSTRAPGDLYGLDQRNDGFALDETLWHQGGQDTRPFVTFYKPAVILPDDPTGTRYTLDVTEFVQSFYDGNSAQVDYVYFRFCYDGEQDIGGNTLRRISIYNQIETGGSGQPDLPEDLPELVLTPNPGVTTDPSPEDGAIHVPLDTTVSWQTGVDPDDPTIPNPAVGRYYLYGSTNPDFVGVEPIVIDAADPVEATVQYGPLALQPDTVYYWRVDQGVYINGTISGKDAPETIRGQVWTFETRSPLKVLTAPFTANEYVCGLAQDILYLGYYEGPNPTDHANQIGSSGGSGNRRHFAPMMKFDLPVIKGSGVLKAELSFVRGDDDNDRGTNPPADLYGLDPRISGFALTEELWYQGPEDARPFASFHEPGVLHQEDPQGTRYTVDVTSYIKSFYDGPYPEAESVYFRLNQSTEVSEGSLI